MEIKKNYYNFFDKKICINLEKRKDRLERSLQVFKNFNIDVEIFKAIDGNTLINPTITIPIGNYGLNKTSEKIFEECIELNINNVLIFEDDVELHDDFHLILNQALNQLPEDWEMLYFGGNHIGGVIPYTNNLNKLLKTYAAHAFVINKNIFSIILDDLKKFTNLENDVIYSNLHSRGKSFVITPHIAWQRPDYSNIQNNYVNYDFLKYG